MEETFDPEWPGIGGAYDFVEASYDWVLQRAAALDARLTSLLAYSGVLAFAAPVVARALTEAPDYDSTLFNAGLALFVGIAVGVVLVRLVGGVRVPTQDILTSQRWLNQPDDAFRRDMVDLGGRDLRHNLSVMRWRGLLTDMLGLLFAAQVVVLSVWVSQTF